MEEELRVDDVPGDNNLPNNDEQRDGAGLQPQQPLNGWGNDVDDLGDNTIEGAGRNDDDEGWGNDADGLEENDENNQTESNGTDERENAPGQQPVRAAALANDDMNEEIAHVMANNMDGERRGENAPGGNGDPFDKLEDLVKKKSKKESRRGRKAKQDNNAGQGGGSPAGTEPERTNTAGTGLEQGAPAQDDTPEAVKKSVDELRGGQLYMAVVLARQLEKGGHNPMADNKFKRFFNSSTFNSATDKIKLAGAVSATGSLLDPTYKTSSLSQAVSLVSNLVGLVTTIKSIVQKIKKFKSNKGKTDRAMGVIELISDFAMAVSKGVGIVQAIAVLSGKFEGIFKKVMGYMTVFLNGASQISGFIAGANGLKKARGKLKEMKEGDKGEAARWAVVKDKVIPKYSEPEGGSSQAEEGEEESRDDTSAANTGRPAQATTGEGGMKKRLSPKQKREQAKQLKQTRKERRSLANMLLRREDVADEDKDKLVSYIALCRMIEKTKSGIGMGASGLVATAIGLGTSIATGISFTGDEKAVEAGNNLGIISGFMGSGISLAKMGIDKTNQKKQNNEETEMIKGRLWGLIHGLDDDKYGLKGISESLEAAPSPEKAKEAQDVVKKYKAVDGHLQGSFVNYGAVLKASNAEEFRKLLVAGI